jgi:hypothetical protein
MEKSAVIVVRACIIGKRFKLFLICKTEFSFKSVERRHQELLAVLGNLILRLAGKKVNPQQVVPSGPTREYTPSELALIQKLNTLSGKKYITIDSKAKYVH